MTTSPTRIASTASTTRSRRGRHTAALDRERPEHPDLHPLNVDPTVPLVNRAISPWVSEEISRIGADHAWVMGRGLPAGAYRPATCAGSQGEEIEGSFFPVIPDETHDDVEDLVFPPFAVGPADVRAYVAVEGDERLLRDGVVDRQPVA